MHVYKLSRCHLYTTTSTNNYEQPTTNSNNGSSKYKKYLIIRNLVPFREKHSLLKFLLNLQTSSSGAVADAF